VPLPLDLGRYRLFQSHVVANDRIEDAVEKLKSIIITERCRKVKGLVLEENKRQWEEKGANLLTMTHEKGIEGRERGRGQSGDRIEGASRFSAFCKIRHGMATYKSDFEGRLWW